MVGKDGQLDGFFRKKIQETPIELMGKTMVSSRFSLKSTHWGGKPSPGNFPSLSPPGRRGEVRRPTAASKGGALWRPARMEEFFGMEKWEISTWKNGTNGDFDLENWEKLAILTWKHGEIMGTHMNLPWKMRDWIMKGRVRTPQHKLQQALRVVEIFGMKGGAFP